MSTTVFHIEDDALWAKAVRDAIVRWPEFEHLGIATSGKTGIDQYKKLNPDILILDIMLPDMTGLSVIGALEESNPGSRILLLTCRADDFTLSHLDSGQVMALLWKTPNLEYHLSRALFSLANGKKYLSPEVQTALQRFHRAPESFHKIISLREQELLVLVAQGYSDSEIAAVLGLRSTTVKTHRANIMSKLQLHRTHDLILWAQQKGFFVPQIPAPPCMV